MAAGAIYLDAVGRPPRRAGGGHLGVGRGQQRRAPGSLAAHCRHRRQPAQALSHATLIAQLAEGGQAVMEQALGPRRVAVVESHVAQGVVESGVVAQRVGLAVESFSALVVTSGPLIVPPGAGHLANVVEGQSDLPWVADTLGQGQRLTQPRFGLCPLA